MPQWMGGWEYVAIAAAHLGDWEAAKEAVRWMLELTPSFSVAAYRRRCGKTRVEMIPSGA
jgi:hypothetical protein